MARRVLIVDGDTGSRRQAIYALLPAGFEVDVAEDTVEASSAIARQLPDLVVLGDSMVHPAGLAFVGRLMTSAATAPVPVLIVANGDENQAAAARAGARAVLPGPLAGADLLAAVTDQIERPAPLPQAPSAVLDDPERLAAVEALRPDRAGNPDFDRFTHLTAKMLGVPVSTMVLIENDQQVYASQVGVGEPWASAGGVPLEYSYCQYAITTREPLRISDASKHPLVSNSPAVTELDAIAYVGIPLITSDGNAVGTLCAIDSQPRDWTDHQVGILNDLAGILTAQLDATLASGRTGRHGA